MQTCVSIYKNDYNLLSPFSVVCTYVLSGLPLGIISHIWGLIAYKSPYCFSLWFLVAYLFGIVPMIFLPFISAYLLLSYLPLFVTDHIQFLRNCFCSFMNIPYKFLFYYMDNKNLIMGYFDQKTVPQLYYGWIVSWQIFVSLKSKFLLSRAI